MRKIRTLLLKNVFLVYITTAVLMITSCTKQSTLAGAVKTVSPADYSGEDLFLAILFFDGNAKSLLPEDFREMNIAYFTNDKNILEASKKFESDLIRHLHATDENFFNDFKKKVCSGDYETIKNEVNKAGAMILEYAQTSSKMDKNQFASIVGSVMKQVPDITSVRDAKQLKETIYQSNLKAPPYVHIAVAVETVVVAVIAAMIMLVVGLQSDAYSDVFLTQEYMSMLTTSFNTVSNQ